MNYEAGDADSIINIRNVTQWVNAIGYFIGVEYWISLKENIKKYFFMNKGANGLYNQFINVRR